MEEEEARSANRVADPYLDAGVAMTETEIAEELGISKQRVCQLLQHGDRFHGIAVLFQERCRERECRNSIRLCLRSFLQHLERCRSGDQHIGVRRERVQNRGE